MLRVTIELVPFGDEARAEVVDVIEIVNDGTGTIEVGNYDVVHGGQTARVTRHYRTGGALQLVRRALEALEAQRH